MSCPDEAALWAYVGDSSSDDSRQVIRAHLEDCVQCRAFVSAHSPLTSVAATERNAGMADASAEPLLEPGAEVGRYRVIGHLGSGGMGVVYSAHDPELDRKVALKLIRVTQPAQQREVSRGRLLREAQAMARIAHPNVVNVYDVGVWNESVFVAMELIEGETLGLWLRYHRGDWQQALTLLVAAGRGLAAAHAANLVHRDFKPDNVLVGNDGRVCVTDFGIARPAGPAPTQRDDDLGSSPSRLHERLTQTGALLGTPAYMAPEQMHGEPSDARADVFSFCVVLYEALYGERPFRAETLAGLAAQMTTGQVAAEPPSTAVPARLRASVLRGLRADPGQRFATMQQLLSELTWDPAVRRRRWLAGAALSALLLVLAGGVVAMRRLDRRACDDGRAQLTGVWDDARRKAVGAAFAATGVPYAATTTGSVRRELDRFADGWRAMHREACEATRIRGEQSAALLDLRMECLEDRRRALGAMTELFSRADAGVVERAMAATAALGGLEPCADARTLRAPIRPPSDPNIQRRVTELRGRLLGVRALYDAGRFDDALAQAPDLVVQARAAHDQPIEAEALLLLGQLQFKKAQPEAEKTLKLAVIAAEAGRDDRAAAQAWIQLVSVEDNTIVENQGAAEESGRHGEAYLARTGDDDRLRVALSLALSVLNRNEGKWTEARREIERALVAARRAYGNEHPMVARCLEQLGQILHDDQGEAAIRHALAINEKELGVDHPDTGHSYFMLGAILVGPKGWPKNEEAIAAYRHGIRIFEKSSGADSPDVAFGLSRLADLLGSRDNPGDLDESLVLEQRAIAIYRAKNPAGRDVGNALALIARLYQAHHQSDVALARLAEAEGILAPALGKTSPYVGWMVYHSRGQVLAELHRNDEAAASFEAALATKMAPIGESLTQFDLGRSLWDTGRPQARLRAVGLVRQARAALVTSGTRYQELVTRIDQWLNRYVPAQ